MTHFDKRLHAIRDDLADARLKSEVAAPRYVQGRRAFVRAPVVDLKRKPSESAGIDTQLIYGAPVLLFDEAEGWAWVQAEQDGYVGYVDAGALAEAQEHPTHRVVVPRTFIYPGADLRFPRASVLSMGSVVAISGEAETRGTRYALTADGNALIAAHLQPIDAEADDYVSIAQLFLNTPYLWGGTTGFGIDCSGLVQTSMMMAGRKVLRDTDMQEATIGEEINPENGLRRGDLVFWKGHVAIMVDPELMIHANGHTMLVSLELLADAIERIGYLYGHPNRYRRP
ncbi:MULTISPECIES: NlpC/P60 family protein [Mesorhizobium]|uniref:Peptidase P60 n=1 Tax=Mesorhizobium denitrificans TaxID=2294114 RepID=A0A371XK20_9HYPH|nr:MULTISPECIES: NlpC/P60 family protein [Mesorhizobium]RFC69578.1 peptidase P60 [Mesorhizobium denitrificans]